jgi:hypothetical protein
VSSGKLRVGALGMGWWSDVLAMQRSDQFEIVSCFTRSGDKRKAEKYDCQPLDSYETMLNDDSIAAIINTTPNNVHLETTRQAAQGRQARVPRQADCLSVVHVPVYCGPHELGSLGASGEWNVGKTGAMTCSAPGSRRFVSRR